MTESTPPSGDKEAGASLCDGDPNCEEALRDLYEYLDGEMTDERCARIRVHIDECAPCLEAFDFETELRDLVARTCRCEAPESLRDRVAEAIRQCEQDPEGQSAH